MPQSLFSVSCARALLVAFFANFINTCLLPVNKHNSPAPRGRDHELLPASRCCLDYFHHCVIVYAAKWHNDMQSAAKHHCFFPAPICCLIAFSHRVPTRLHTLCMAPWVVFQAASCDFSQRGLMPGVNFLPLIPAYFLLHFICVERSFEISYQSSLLAVDTNPGRPIGKNCSLLWGLQNAVCLSRWLAFLEPHLLKLLELLELRRSQMSLPEKW